MPKPDRAPGDYSNPWEAEDGAWYFYDETEATHGPFPTVTRAAQEFRWYCLWLDGKLSAEVIALLRSNTLTLSEKTQEDLMATVEVLDCDAMPPMTDDEVEALHVEAERQRAILANDETPVLGGLLPWLLVGMIAAAAYFYWCGAPRG